MNSKVYRMEYHMVDEKDCGTLFRPREWLIKSGKQFLWPKNHSFSTIKQLMKDRVKPEEDWEPCDIVETLGEAGEYVHFYN